jgi:1,6-anhydro-N-acetylmuramate kinase
MRVVGIRHLGGRHTSADGVDAALVGCHGHTVHHDPSRREARGAAPPTARSSARLRERYFR